MVTCDKTLLIKSNLFSSKISTDSWMRKLFLTVQHLNFSVTCECHVKFKVKLCLELLLRFHCKEDIYMENCHPH